MAETFLQQTWQRLADSDADAANEAVNNVLQKRRAEKNKKKVLDKKVVKP